jgi:hypothetical protein
MADLTALRSSGMEVDSLPEDQKSALDRLSQDEVDTLASIRSKLNEEPEVGGHLASSRAMAGDGGIIW